MDQQRRKTSMVRDDTYPLPENRVRAPFRDMTTAEAEYHAETMWPYFDSRVGNMVQDILKQQVSGLIREKTLDVLADLIEINTATPEGRGQLKAAFRIIRMLGDLRQFIASICIKCLLPWTLAAGAGIVGLIFKDSVPELVRIVQHVKQLLQL
jgi:hypothetical protein